MKINKIIENLYNDGNSIIFVDDIAKEASVSRVTLMKKIKVWVSQNETNAKLIIGRRGGKTRIEMTGATKIKKEPVQENVPASEDVVKGKSKKEEDFYYVKNNLNEKYIPWDKRYVSVPLKMKNLQTSFTIPLDISRKEWDNMIDLMKRSLKRKEVMDW